MPFPPSPTVDDVYANAGHKWQWNGAVWAAYSGIEDGSRPLYASVAFPGGPLDGNVWPTVPTPDYHNDYYGGSGGSTYYWQYHATPIAPHPHWQPIYHFPPTPPHSESIDGTTDFPPTVVPLADAGGGISTDTIPATGTLVSLTAGVALALHGAPTVAAGIRDGQIVWLRNDSAFNLTLVNNGGIATGLTLDAATMTLAPGGMVALMWDATDTTWRQWGNSSFSKGGVQVTLTEGAPTAVLPAADAAWHVYLAGPRTAGRAFVLSLPDPATQDLKSLIVRQTTHAGDTWSFQNPDLSEVATTTGTLAAAIAALPTSVWVLTPHTDTGVTKWLAVQVYPTPPSVGALVLAGASGGQEAFGGVADDESLILHGSHVSGGWTTAWKGDWELGVVYAVGDTVEYLGVEWTCRIAHTSSGTIAIPNPAFGSSAYWRQAQPRGSVFVDDKLVIGDANLQSTRRLVGYTTVAGSPNITAVTPAAWSAGTAYVLGSLVSSGGIIYICILAVTGGTGPATDTSHWQASSRITVFTQADEGKTLTDWVPTLGFVSRFAVGTYIVSVTSPTTAVVSDPLGATATGNGNAYLGTAASLSQSYNLRSTDLYINRSGRVDAHDYDPWTFSPIRLHMDYVVEDWPGTQAAYWVPGPAGWIQVDGTIQVGSSAPDNDNFAGTLLNSSRSFTTVPGEDAYPGGFLSGTTLSDSFYGQGGSRFGVMQILLHCTNLLVTASGAAPAGGPRSITEIGQVQDFTNEDFISNVAPAGGGGATAVGAWTSNWAVPPYVTDRSLMQQVIGYDYGIWNPRTVRVRTTAGSRVITAVDVSGNPVHGFSLDDVGGRLVFTRYVASKAARTITDAHTTVGSPVLTSSTAQFTDDDIGYSIAGNIGYSGIPAGAVIIARASGTSVTMGSPTTSLPLNATAAYTAAHVTIQPLAHTSWHGQIQWVGGPETLGYYDVLNDEPTNITPRTFSDASTGVGDYFLYSTSAAAFTADDVGSLVTSVDLAWSSTTAYTAGMRVSYLSNSYVCTNPVTGGAGPVVDTTHWSAAPLAIPAGTYINSIINPTQAVMSGYGGADIGPMHSLPGLQVTLTPVLSDIVGGTAGDAYRVSVAGTRTAADTHVDPIPFNYGDLIQFRDGTAPWGFWSEPAGHSNPGWTWTGWGNLTTAIDADWSAATAYTAGQRVNSGVISYRCISSVGPTATAPAADPTHWAIAPTLFDGGIARTNNTAIMAEPALTTSNDTGYLVGVGKNYRLPPKRSAPNTDPTDGVLTGPAYLGDHYALRAAGPISLYPTGNKAIMDTPGFPSTGEPGSAADRLDFAVGDRPFIFANGFYGSTVAGGTFPSMLRFSGRQQVKVSGGSSSIFGVVNTFNAIDLAGTIENDPTSAPNVDLGRIVGFRAANTYNAYDHTGIRAQITEFKSEPTIAKLGAGTWHNSVADTYVHGFSSRLTVNAGIVLPERMGFVFHGQQGAGSVTTQYGFYSDILGVTDYAAWLAGTYVSGLGDLSVVGTTTMLAAARATGALLNVSDAANPVYGQIETTTGNTGTPFFFGYAHTQWFYNRSVYPVAPISVGTIATTGIIAFSDGTNPADLTVRRTVDLSSVVWLDLNGGNFKTTGQISGGTTSVGSLTATSLTVNGTSALNGATSVNAPGGAFSIADSNTPITSPYLDYSSSFPGGLSGGFSRLGFWFNNSLTGAATHPAISMGYFGLYSGLGGGGGYVQFGDGTNNADVVLLRVVDGTYGNGLGVRDASNAAYKNIFASRGIFASDVRAVQGVFSGAVSGTTGAFTGAVTGTSFVATDQASGTSGLVKSIIVDGSAHVLSSNSMAGNIETLVGPGATFAYKSFGSGYVGTETATTSGQVLVTHDVYGWKTAGGSAQTAAVAHLQSLATEAYTATQQGSRWVLGVTQKLGTGITDAFTVAFEDASSTWPHPYIKINSIALGTSSSGTDAYSGIAGVSTQNVNLANPGTSYFGGRITLGASVIIGGVVSVDAGLFTLTNGSASNLGKIVNTASGPGNTNTAYWNDVSVDTAARVFVGIGGGGFSNGISMGPGTGAYDVSFLRTGTGTALLTGAITISSTLTVNGASISAPNAEISALGVSVTDNGLQAQTTSGGLGTGSWTATGAQVSIEGSASTTPTMNVYTYGGSGAFGSETATAASQVMWGQYSYGWDTALTGIVAKYEVIANQLFSSTHHGTTHAWSVTQANGTAIAAAMGLNYLTLGLGWAHPQLKINTLALGTSSGTDAYTAISDATTNAVNFQNPGTSYFGGVITIGASAAMTSSSAITATAFTATGLTGSVAASRYVGATASGAPATGPHIVGDWCIDQTGAMYVCTVLGTPGTWVAVGSNASALASGTVPTARLGSGTANSTTVLQGDQTWAVRDGWVSAANTWVFVSGTSFKIVGVDATGWLTKGTKVSWNDATNTPGYGVIASSVFGTDTTVTLITTTDYVIANHVITAPRYSYEASPVGFPGWFNWTPTLVGWSANPTTTVNRWTPGIGNTITISIHHGVNGTSSGVIHTATLPVSGAGVANALWATPAIMVDNGVQSIGYVQVSSLALTVVALQGLAAGGNTAAGSASRVVAFELAYEY